MDTLLLVYGIVISFALMFVMLYMGWNDETQRRKWARVRVRVDDKRQGKEPPSEEESGLIDSRDVILAALVLLLGLIIAQVRY